MYLVSKPYELYVWRICEFHLLIPKLSKARLTAFRLGLYASVLPVASGGIHVWHMPALTEIFGDDSVLQFGGGTLGHPWGNAPGAVANRVALEACVQDRNEGRDLAREGNEIIREASKWSPELAAACEVWKEIKFEFEPVDKLDKEKKVSVHNSVIPVCSPN
ncbi:hypothetical protein C4D60_Mb00t19340 [Musa balbisiana]|uniref:Ribulose bisphosphate carboxylase large subunit C-terminal domain-containing protein n=1 Tax=Musa balbisiana TaxID=52838 RepID=A0A4S8I4C2_MUSBA|nr:hypothetical protein C4D60_Mb00t19340 [Musa balbisiana]